MKQENSKLAAGGDQAAESRNVEILTVDGYLSFFTVEERPSVATWKSENSAAVQEFNRFVAKFGLLLTEFRKF